MIIDRWLYRYSFQNLLIWLLIHFTLSPFIDKLPSANVILTVSISLVLFFGVYAIEKKSKLLRWTTISVLAISLLLLWVDVLRIVSYPRIINTLITLVYVSLLIYSFAKYVYRSRVVNTSLICAALCLYLFLGTFWGYLYEALELIRPGSFGGELLAKAKFSAELRQAFQYFSFVTLTTLGYGDILPKTVGAAALCHTEAVMGQFFMAVLVARLVGIQVAQQFSNSAKSRDPHNQNN